MHKGFIGWSLESIGEGTVETKYTVEYTDDPRVMDYVEKTGDFKTIPIREYDNISEALTFYLVQYMRNICYVSLLERFFVNGEMVLEQPIEPENTIQFHIRNIISRETAERMYSAEKRADELERGNSLYQEFIKKMGRPYEDLFQEFLKMRWKEK